METPLPQTLHGYDRGHRLLAFVGDLSDAERSLIERLSDLSGYTPSGFSFTSYLTGYPCGRYYALACTWPDLTAERGGAVLTHTVLLPRALAAAAPSLAPLLTLHRKPTSAADRAPYQSLRPWDPAQVAREPFISPARARAALALVFFQPERPAVWIDAVAPLDGVAHIWRHLWPESRQDFSFCTLSFQPRQVEGRVFTFIGAPPESRGAFPTRGTTRAWWDQGQMGDPRWLSEGAIPALDQLVAGGPAWVKELLNPVREAGLRPPRPHELPQLTQLMELRRAAPSRLSAARGAADLLAALWPDASPSHPWWSEALGHLITRQPDAAISGRPLWELVDLLGRSQLRARLGETELSTDLCEQVKAQVAHRLTEAPAATAEGLSGLLTAIGDTPNGAQLRKAVADGARAAASLSTSPEQAKLITTALLSAREWRPRTEASKAIKLVQLLQALFDQGELSRALEREDWSVELVKHLRPVEHATPDAWFHGVVRLAAQHDEVPDLLAVALRLRPKRGAEINAVLRLFEERGSAAAVVAPTTAVGEVRREPTMKVTPVAEARLATSEWRPVRVLHLSDLHFSAKVAWDQMPVLTSLVSEVKTLRAQLGPIHRVVITGDIANFGTAQEYTEAANWLNGSLAEAAGVKVDQIRMVPGNHDVERSKVGLVESGFDEKVLSGGDDALAALMSDKLLRKMLLARQTAYRKFAKGFNPEDDRPGWCSEEEIEGWSVHFIGLNTAWLSGSHKDARGDVDDHRRLAIGGWQWNALFPADRPVADLTIALMHHPWEDLAERESRAYCEAAYDRCGVILRGHLHDVDTLSAKRDGKLVLEAAAGSCYALPSEGWPHGFQLLELDPGVGRARVVLRKWHSKTKRWIPDRERYPHTGADGIVELELRRSPNPPKPPPDDDTTEDSTDEPPPVRTVRDHYAALLKDQLNQLPDVFRVTDGPSTVAGVYVEVTLATSGRDLDCAPDALHGQGREASLKVNASVDDLRGRVPLTDVLNHRHRRWGLLGDPGSGKTTLLRHVAVELLSEPDGPLPIYLKVAELEHGLSPAITALCASFNAPQLAKHLLTEAQAGRAVLLIDGLDEAVDLLAARRWVISAAADVGEHSQVIVASRPIGYKEPSAAFKTLTICPLAAEQQTELLTRWVTDRAKVTAALERLSRTPRLRRLAENPLLLTLVGLLLRAGQDVPSRRGDLYERALKLLLTRDHNNEDAAPVAPMREPELTLELLGWAALRLHGLEGEAYRARELIAALEADARNVERLGKHWPSAAKFIAEVAERTGLLIPDTGRVRDATAYSFPHRTFREFLAATALERDMGAVAAGVASGAGELARVFAEGKARPERWAEVLALTCGRLGPGGADGLVRRITQQGNTALLLRVVADAEGISAETVRRTLKLELGWKREQLEARQKVIEEIPALVKDLAVAVGLLEQAAKATTCGHDLFWVREVLRRIERGEVEAGVLEGTVDDAKRAAKGAADNVLSHLDPAKRAALVALLKPWWRAVPAGSFDMGGESYHNDAKPAHSVTFTSGFQMLSVPVTWAMYRLFDPGHDAARSDFSGQLPPEAQDEVPVYNVSWFASVMFAEWAGARLPLEPEWEYACRAGTRTRLWSGDSDADLARVGWTKQNSWGHPHPVKQKPGNAWGLYDVHGNVWEWCADVYDGNVYASRADGLTVDPRYLTFAVGHGLPMSAESADRGAPRVVRGGSWQDRPEDALSAVRDWSVPLGVHTDLGFRLLLCPIERP